MSREAMKLALEHAKRDERHLNHAETRYWCRMYRDIAEKAVEALAKPDFWEGYVPEPVKPAQQEPEHMVSSNRRYSPLLTHMMNKRVKSNLKQVIELYDSPEQPAQQEPVATKLHEAKQNFERNFGPHAMADWIYSDLLEWLGDTSPPAQRTWVGLTDEEIDKLDCVHALWDDGESCTIMGIKDFAQAIEAKLREKNNG